MPEYEIKKADKSGDLDKVNKGFEILKERAAQGNMYYYSDFYKQISSPTEELPLSVGSGVLADISIYTQKKYGHMLSAIVISKNNKLLGDGFYRLAMELGVLDEDITEEEKYSFWANEFNKIKNYWAKHYKESN